MLYPLSYEGNGLGIVARPVREAASPAATALWSRTDTLTSTGQTGGVLIDQAETSGPLPSRSRLAGFRPSRRALIVTGAWALAPWTWFLVRDLHPRFDMIALGLPVIVAVAVAGCALLALVRRRLAPLVTTMSWVVFGLAVVVGPWMPQSSSPPVGGFRVAAVNVYGHFPAEDDIAEDVLDQDADVVVISEMSDAMDDQVLPQYRHVLRSQPVGKWDLQDVAVASRFPLTELPLPGKLAQRGVRARVDAPGGSFILYGVHMPPVRLTPTSKGEVGVPEHQRIVKVLRDMAAAEELPVVVAGDLNLVDRAWGYRALSGELDDAMRAGWVKPTSLKTSALPILARVDHVFIPESWCSVDPSIFKLRGSDHRGVAATVGPCQ